LLQRVHDDELFMKCCFDGRLQHFNTSISIRGLRDCYITTFIHRYEYHISSNVRHHCLCPVPTASTSVNLFGTSVALHYYIVPSYINVGSYSSLLASEALLHHYTDETFVTCRPVDNKTPLKPAASCLTSPKRPKSPYPCTLRIPEELSARGFLLPL
jgi:hypothetical protein